MEGEGGMGEGLDEEPETDRNKVNKIIGPSHKYEIIGTLEYDFHNKSEDILYTIDESKEEEFMSEIMKCGYIIYDITKNKSEIPKALATLAGNRTIFAT